MLDATHWTATLADALATMKNDPSADRAQYLLHHGTMRIGVYAPISVDDQVAHPQDEIYIVRSGQGVFEKNSRRIEFKADDVLFVEAGAHHQFLTFTPDFATWVIFWGPAGGETVHAAWRPSCAS